MSVLLIINNVTRTSQDFACILIFTRRAFSNMPAILLQVDALMKYKITVVNLGLP